MINNNGKKKKKSGVGARACAPQVARRSRRGSSDFEKLSAGTPNLPTNIIPTKIA